MVNRKEISNTGSYVSWTSSVSNCIKGTYLFEILNEFHKKVSIAKYLSSEDLIKFSDIVETQGKFECVTEKNGSEGK